MSPSRIVITGLIASGKSTVADILKEKGYYLISADEVNRDLIKKGGKNYIAIKNEPIFAPAFDGDFLDKKKLAEIIFNDKEKMERLNEISHTNIIGGINEMVENSKEDKVFIEVPLFFKIKDRFPHDLVVLVTASREVQIKRLMARDNIDYNFALKKIESQDELEEMKKQSDIIIDNSGDIESLRRQIEKIIKRGDFNESC